MGCYTVIAAPGYHGDEISVYAVFETAARALKYAGRGGCRVLAGVDGYGPGDKIFRGVCQDMINRGDWRIVSGVQRIGATEVPTFK